MTTESSNNVKKDNIISQSPKNTEVEEGSTVQFIVSKGKASSKDEDKDSEKSKSSSEDKSDDTQKVKNYTETYHIPYTGDDESQKVQVYIRDKDNSGTSASQTFSIKDDKTITIPLKIEQGSDAGYTIRVDGDVIADKDIEY